MLLALTAIMLTGCGSTNRTADLATANYITASDSKEAAFVSTDTYMDYGNISISGDLADYSYQFNAKGKVKDKDTVLTAYNRVQAFVNEKEGYISDFNNNYTGYPIEKGASYFSDTELYNKASGTLSFSVEVKNEYAKEVIQILDDFVNENQLCVTRYVESATNYKDYKIVDSYDDPYYNYEEITQEELERRLAYSTITVRLSYYIPRSSAQTFGLKVRSVFGSIKEIILSVALVLLIVVVSIWVIAILGIVPIYKCIRKSVMKHRKKRPELYPAKEIRLVGEEKKEEE